MVPCISDFKNYCNFEKLKQLIEDDIDYDTFNDAYEEQTNRLKKLIKLEFLGNGCSRACFKINDNYVAKVPLGSEGIEANYSESKLLKFLEEKNLGILKKYLCPIIENSEDILLFPMCERINPKKIKNKLQEIENKFAQHGIVFSDLWYIENFGILNGKIVIIDYADWNYGK